MKYMSLCFILGLFSICSQAQEGQGCFFNNQIIFDGNSVTAYLNSTAPFGSQCVSETRTCTNGILSGSYNFGSCNVDAPAACLFNGQTINSGDTVAAYQNSTVPYGQTCISQTETCSNGSFDGNYQYASCDVADPAACLFNGLTINSGDAVTAYQNSTVPYGQTCVSQVETCTDGSFDGAYQYSSCNVAAPAACLFNGQTLANGQSVVAYPASTVPYGQTCVSQLEFCDNGVLSGNDPYPSCSVDAPASCMFNGAPLSSGQTVVAYESSTVPFGQTCVSRVETCFNGNLDGSFAFASCSVGAPAACVFNGQMIANGQTVLTYASSNVPYGQTCMSVSETCNNGVLSGNNPYATCTVGSPAPCTFDGQTIPDGHSVLAYQSASVPHGEQCASQQRNCSNGVLSGTYSFNACTVDGGTPPPKPPTPPAPPEDGSCVFHHHKVLEGDAVLAYQFPFSYDPKTQGQPHNPLTNHCKFDWEFRRCHKGKLMGHFEFAYCKDSDEPVSSKSVQ